CTGSATFHTRPFAMPAVTGAPYSGEESNEQVQTLSDGTHITHKNPGNKVWRDSQGRTRTERPLFSSPNGSDPNRPQVSVVEISDPIAGFYYVLDTQNKIAHRSAMAAPPGPQAGRVGGFTSSST